MALLPDFHPEFFETGRQVGEPARPAHGELTSLANLSDSPARQIARIDQQQLVQNLRRSLTRSRGPEANCDTSKRRE